MKTNPTRHKLNESEYFLKMAKALFENDDEFSYSISAFLSAARSITFYMQKQYGRCYGFPDWYSRKQVYMLADDDFNFLNNARVETIHKAPVRTGASREVTIKMNAIIGSLSKEESQQMKDADSKPPEQGVPKTVRRFFPDHASVDVIPLCEKQLAELRALVDECESRFLSLP
jgi:hypothetical protein